jgi:hypothetical protein
LKTSTLTLGLLVLTSGCYTATPPDASTPRDTPSIDAAVATPDTFAWPDTNRDTPLSAWEQAIADGCAGGEPNMLAVASNPRDPVWPGVQRVGPVMWRDVGTTLAHSIGFADGEGPDYTVLVRVTRNNSLMALGPGTFSPVTNTEDRRSRLFGLEVQVDRVGCPATGGTLTIHEVVERDGGVSRFRASFQQECAGFAILRGCIRYTVFP